MPGLQSQRPRRTGTNVRSVICSLRDVVAMGKLDEVAAVGARLIGLEQRTDPFSNASRSVKLDTSTPHTACTRIPHTRPTLFRLIPSSSHLLCTTGASAYSTRHLALFHCHLLLHPAACICTSAVFLPRPFTRSRTYTHNYCARAIS